MGSKVLTLLMACAILSLGTETNSQQEGQQRRQQQVQELKQVKKELRGQQAIERVLGSVGGKRQVMIGQGVRIGVKELRMLERVAAEDEGMHEDEAGRWGQTV